MNNTCLNSSFHENLGKLVPQSQNMLDFARYDGDGVGTSWNFKTCKAPSQITTNSMPTLGYFTNWMPFYHHHGVDRPRCFFLFVSQTNVLQFYLSLKKHYLSILVGILTSHIMLNSHLTVMKTCIHPLCPVCMMKNLIWFFGQLSCF